MVKMKKILLIVLAVLGMASSSIAQEPGKDNGFSARVFFEHPLKSYSCEESQFYGRWEFEGVLFGFELKNRWYVWNNNKIGLAVDAHWLSAAIGRGDIAVIFEGLYSEEGPLERDIDRTDYICYEVDFLGVGPLFTYYIDEQMAVDVSYNLLPTFMYLSSRAPSRASSLRGFDLTHAIGVSLRWRYLLVGAEFGFGNIEMDKIDYDDYKYDSHSNNLKFLFGFKF